MTNLDRPTDGDLEEGLSRVWTAHLQREEVLLDATVKSLRHVRTAIIDADWERLPDLLTFQDHLRAEAHPLAQARESLRKQLAPHLGVSPEDVTLRGVTIWFRLASGTNPLVGCERLMQKLNEAETLRCTIATLVRSSLSLYQNLLGRLAGGESAERYGPGGKWQGFASGSLIQGRG